jgi:nitrate reductase alpha subunit
MMVLNRSKGPVVLGRVPRERGGEGVEDSKSSRVSFSTNLGSLSPFMMVSGRSEALYSHEWSWGEEEI